jgi:trimethylamine---corrinoid protein Co-methyltransferase
MKSFATLLTQQQVERTHAASLEILENIGMLVRNEKARTIFKRHGCKINPESHIVKFPYSVVEKFRAMLPPTFTFFGRDPKFDQTIPKDAPVIVTGSSAPNIIDPVTGRERRARSDDIARIAHLIHELPAYDVFSISTLAEDAPKGQFTLARLYPALKHCLKPIRCTTENMEDTTTVMQLLYSLAGGEEAFRERPFVTFHYCPVVSPLTMDQLSTEAVMFFCEAEMPVYPSIVPNAGLTSPMSMAGTLAQGNAEFLAISILMQMVREGTPTIYATLPTVADMRTGAYASGGIECGMLHMAFSQMARFYNVPCGGYIGLSNSKLNDAQSGFETGMSTAAGVLAGTDMLNMGGLLDALKVFDFAKAVIDDEIGLMLKRLKRGIPFSEEELGLQVIAQTGPGGSFMMNPHTARRMKSEALLPRLADREGREVWEKKGSLDIHARALLRANEILGKDSGELIPTEVDKRLHAMFKDLVSGNLEIPRDSQAASWQKRVIV